MSTRVGGKRRPRNPEPQTAASLIPDVVARLGGQDRGVLQRVTMAWAESVGAMLALRARPESLKGKTLFVRLESSALAHEITLMKAEIVARLCLALGAPLIEDLRTRIGPLD